MIAALPPVSTSRTIRIAPDQALSPGAAKGLPRTVSGVPRGQRECLYAANTGLVRKVLNGFRLTGELRDEAYGAGLLALWDAAGRFDASRGFTFATYACRYIEGGILRCLADRRRQNRIETVSLETPLGDGEKGLADVTPDPATERPGAVLVSRAGFDSLLAGLNDRQQSVLRAIYQEGLTSAEVAARHGISAELVRAIHHRAIMATRKAIELRQAEEMRTADEKAAAERKEYAALRRTQAAAPYLAASRQQRPTPDSFVPHRPPYRVWQEFLGWWEAKYPGRPLPAKYNLRGLTGLSDEFLSTRMK